MKNIFENKNCLVYGMGKSGKSARELLIKLKANVFSYDDNLPFNKYELNEVFIKNLDYIIVSPSVSIYSEWIKIAYLFKVKVISEMELGYLLTKRSNHIAITGTNGKTTTVSLIHSLLDYAGRENSLVGNIGYPITRKINEYMAIQKEYNSSSVYYVEECSSFQLESVREYKPNISVLLNVKPNHLDRHFTFNEYVEAKMKIIKNSKRKDILIVNYDDEVLRENTLNVNVDRYYVSLNDKVRGAYILDNNIIFSNGKRFEYVGITDNLKLIGRHNLYNVLVAVLIGKLLNIQNEIIMKSLESFNGLEHRIEFVEELNGVTFINDSKSTTFESTLVAVNSFMDRNINLIIGGRDKGVCPKEFLLNLPLNVKSIVVYGEVRDKFIEIADEIGIGEIISVASLKDALIEAMSRAKKDEIILLSPAYSSFDQFSSFEERGDFFKSLVKKYKSMLKERNKDEKKD